MRGIQLEETISKSRAKSGGYRGDLRDIYTSEPGSDGRVAWPNCAQYLGCENSCLGFSDHATSRRAYHLELFFILAAAAAAAAGPAQRPSEQRHRPASLSLRLSLANNFAESEARTGTFFTPSTATVRVRVRRPLLVRHRGEGGGRCQVGEGSHLTSMEGLGRG